MLFSIKEYPWREDSVQHLLYTHFYDKIVATTPRNLYQSRWGDYEFKCDIMRFLSVYIAEHPNQRVRLLNYKERQELRLEGNISHYDVKKCIVAVPNEIEVTAQLGDSFSRIGSRVGVKDPMLPLFMVPIHNIRSKNGTTYGLSYKQYSEPAWCLILEEEKNG